MSLTANVKDLGGEPFTGSEALLTLTAPGLAPLELREERCRLAAALGFCGEEKRYGGAVAAAYTAWTEANKIKLLNAAIDGDLLQSASYFTGHSLLGEAEFQAALERAQQQKRMEIVALLLEYRNRSLSAADAFGKYSLGDF